jgi:hypothetical protein
MWNHGPVTDEAPSDDPGRAERRDLSSYPPKKWLVVGVPALIVAVLAVVLGIPWWIVLIVLVVFFLAIITNG